MVGVTKTVLKDISFKIPLLNNVNNVKILVLLV